MTTISKSILLLLIALPLSGQSAPRIFFSDLKAGLPVD